MTVKEITNILEDWAPLEQAEDFDNVGLLVGDKTALVTGVLVTLDTLEVVVDEAIANNCNLIVSFHPIIFDGLKKITGSSYVERVVLKAIRNNIAIYSMHTALDNAPTGVNAKICEVLGIQNPKVLLPKNTNAILTENNRNANHTANIGMGMIGSLEKPINDHTFLKEVKEKMNAQGIRHSELLHREVQKIAVLGGSGAFAIEAAKAAGADIFITADVKYHQFYAAESKMVVADIGHYETEQFTKNLIVDYLRKKIPNFAVRLSESKTNPINYL